MTGLALMRSISAAALVFGLLDLLPCQPSLADQPLLRPTRDVEVIYHAEGKVPLDQRVRWHAAAQIMRIDPPGAGIYVIIDYLARRTSVVHVAERSVIEMAASNSMADAVAGKGAGGFVRRGEAIVAGLPCTEWETQDRNGLRALVCITSDGVLLRAGTAGRTLVSATSVAYVPQDPAVFQVPPGYARRSLSTRQ